MIKAQCDSCGKAVPVVVEVQNPTGQRNIFVLRKPGHVSFTADAHVVACSKECAAKLQEAGAE